MWRVLSAAAVMTAAVGTGAEAGAAPPSPSKVGTGAAAATWAVGDCFETVDVDLVAVDLATAVDCDDEHAAQIIGGADLPGSLAPLSRAALLATTGADRTALDDFAAETCAPGATVGNLYPKKTAKKLTKLFDEYDVSAYVPPVAGAITILLPDTASFDAGTKAVLCAYLPDESFSGSTAGDVRRAATTDPLESLRICYTRNPGVGTDLATCDEDHDFEALIFLEQLVPDLPDDPNQWDDDDWAGFDEMCADFGPVLVGAKRKDLAYRSNTQTDQAPIEGYRYIYCEALPTKEGARLPGGTTVSAIGKKKITFATG